jgi:hypothetical protein
MGHGKVMSSYEMYMMLRVFGAVQAVIDVLTVDSRC